jgi:hypothetical protein
MRLASLVFCILTSVTSMAQTMQQPDLEAQRAAMKKLGFLIGKWAGEARILPLQGDPVLLDQTEEAHYKLDGLIITIEGIGRRKSDGKFALQAFGVISYDDERGTYHMRAFNDGRFLESEVKLADDGRGLTWGFAVGQFKTNSVLRITGKGDWTEHHEISIGSAAPRKFMEVTVRPRN